MYSVVLISGVQQMESVMLLEEGVCVNRELPDVQAGFRKVRGTRDQTANIHWIRETVREFQENITSASLTMLNPFDCVDHNRL